MNNQKTYLQAVQSTCESPVRPYELKRFNKKINYLRNLKSLEDLDSCTPMDSCTPTDPDWEDYEDEFVDELNGNFGTYEEIKYLRSKIGSSKCKQKWCA